MSNYTEDELAIATGGLIGIGTALVVGLVILAYLAMDRYMEHRERMAEIAAQEACP